jgi:hypothetical protein
VNVGFGSAVITPELPVVLAGFGARKGTATGVHDDLTAQAVVLRSDDVTACLLVLDLLLLGADFAGPVRRAVGAALGIDPAQVMTSCTHTHAGPAATSAVRRIGWPVPAGYLDRVVDGCVSAATAALAACEPATLSYARDFLPAGLSLNRRGLPYEPSYAVLDVRRSDGSRIGSIANVGIHPVALGVTCTEVSGDWVAAFRDAALTRTGAPAVLLPGALGDVNPTRDPHTDPDPGGNWETAWVLGTEVADCVSGLLADCTPLPATLEVLPRPPLRLRAGATLPALLDGTLLRAVDVELQEWSLGGVRLVSVPGEAFHALGRAVERARGDKALLAGLATAYRGYLPRPFGRGYEERMSYGRRFVAGLTEALLDSPVAIS